MQSRLTYLAPLLLMAGCNVSSGDSEPASTGNWDGNPINETDAVVTLELPGEPESIQLNGEEATTLVDRGAGTVKVLIPSDETGISCENTFIVKFADSDPGTLLANHCHGDTRFEVKPGEIVDRRLTKEDVDNPDDDLPPPGESLEFEWSANGFEQLPSRYKWSGGKTVDTGQGYLSLSVPETDDIVWAAGCENGKIVSSLYTLSKDPEGPGKQTIKMEVNGANRTREYTADIVPDGFAPHYLLKLSPNDPIFKQMASGSWLYLQAGDDSSREKLRISLSGSSKALKPILNSCR